jgi:subtilase family serine protease
MRQNRSSVKHRQSRRPRPAFTRCIIAEALELRRMLSAETTLAAVPADLSGIILPADGTIPGSASPSGYTPTQIKDAYGINNISFTTNSGTIAGTGAGQTIAIVDATDNPNFVDTGSANFSTSDLARFDAAMGLPDPPSFMKVNYEGTTDFSGAGYQQSGFGWANEIALDVEWTHAIAPMANILLVECPLNDANAATAVSLLQGGVNYARTVAGVSVVTMSFALPEFIGESINDQYLTTPTGHTGVTFVAATGDNGDPGGYPAFSPNVVAVGATSLSLSNNDTGDSYASEVAHNTSGGGISQYEAKPAWQAGETLSTTNRTIPDVSFDGDENTGVPVYNSYDGGSNTPWYKEGGTSFSTPSWGALVAIADQGRAGIGLGSLDGETQTLPRLYELNYSADYHDITSGSTDGQTLASAGIGYDLTTGLGSPIANVLVPNLAGGNVVSGTIFNDKNDNGQLDSGEPGLSGFTAFVNLYGTNGITGADPQTTSTTNGAFAFTDLPGGTFHFSQVTPSGWDLTTSATPFTLTLGFDDTVTGKNIGFESNGQPAVLAFTQQPSPVMISTNIAPSITVAVEDSDGNIVTGDHSTISLSVAGDTTSLSGQLSATAVNGIATFSDVSVAAAGTYSLLASDGSLASATSNSFVVSVPPPVVATTLVFGQNIASANVGSPIIPSVTVFLESPDGEVVSTDESAVTISLAAGSNINSPTGALTVNAVNGIATFSDIVFTSPGSGALTATDGSLTPATSNTFSAVVVPSRLAFAQEPTDSNIAAAIAPPVTVDVEDLYGQLVTTDSSAVSLAITGGTAVLGGVTTVNAVNGVATFNDLTVPTAGTYTLNATDSSLNGAQSSDFTVAIPGIVVPAVKHSSLAASYIAGSKVRASVSLTQSTAVTGGVDGMVTTSVYAISTSGSMTLLGHVSRTTRLATGRNYPLSVPITLLPSVAGTYTVQVQVTDPLGNHSSSTVGNLNVVAPVIALAPTFVHLTLPAAVVSGSTSRAAAVLRITNSGNITSTGTTAIGIYASPDGLLDDATLIAQVAPRLAIGPKRSAVVTVPLKKIPAGLDGNFTILAQVTDPKADLTSVSSSTTVNIAPATITLSASVASTLPATIAAGRAVTVTFDITNAGNIPSTGTAEITLGLSSDGTTMLPGSTTIGRAVTIPNGKTVPLRLRYVIPTATAAAMYFPFITFSQAGNSVTAFGRTEISVT